MQGIKRKLVYVTAYELIGMSISTLGLALLAGSTPTTTGPLAVVITTVAVTWNFIYNCLFEFWERRQAVRGRSIARRVAHAIGFQLTLVVYLIPLIAWWMGISLLEAFWLDLALIVLIPCYTFLFNWAFDRLFGLPDFRVAGRRGGLRLRIFFLQRHSRSPWPGQIAYLRRTCAVVPVQGGSTTASHEGLPRRGWGAAFR